jgi:peptidoglycan/xylan/chitin deacetylase (PgdA/CDA1 family)
MFKYTIPVILQQLMPSYTWKVDTEDKQLFLTFDDGPHPEITPWVLAQLKEFGAKATFFCVGDNVRKHPEVYQQILKENHAVGNHTFHHLNGWKTETSDYLKDVSLAENYIQSNLFRPPYGRIKRSQAKQLVAKYRIIMWDRLSMDYLAQLNTEESLAQMKKVKKGSIVVFHDSEKAFQNLKVLLPQLLSYYQQQGFSFQTLEGN